MCFYRTVIRFSLISYFANIDKTAHSPFPPFFPFHPLPSTAVKKVKDFVKKGVDKLKGAPAAAGP